MTRDFQLPGRSQVMSTQGMAATSHPSASLVAIQTLAQGGNALDAAVAACAVQCVLEPGSTGIGGDCFVLYSRAASSDLIAYNGSGWAPRAATIAALRGQGLNAIARQSAHAVTVPGAVHAWDTLIRDHGSKALGELLQPAIQFAEQGYAVAPRAGRDWQGQAQLLQADANARKHLLIGGAQAPAIGSRHRQPALAASLRAIAKSGRSAFYEGAIAAEIVAHLRSLGGLHTTEDFAAYAGEYVTPIHSTFRGYEVHECPPSGQGIIALLILNILRGFPAEGDPLSADRLHREIEATRLAYSIRDAVLSDANFAKLDTETILSEAFAANLRAQILPDRANTQLPSYPPVLHPDTAYITVVDKDRNCASFINSIFHPFGSGLMTDQSGVLLHSRGQSFSLQEGHPNAIAPHKRPMHTIIPGMLSKNGKVCMSFGVMGGHYQAMGHAHFISKVLDYGMDMQSAMALPRLFPKPGTDEVEVESSMPAHTCDELRKRGFKLVPPAWAIGGAQAVWIDHDNQVLIGASDHRKDGCALGL